MLDHGMPLTHLTGTPGKRRCEQVGPARTLGAGPHLFGVFETPTLFLWTKGKKCDTLERIDFAAGNRM